MDARPRPKQSTPPAVPEPRVVHAAPERERPATCYAYKRSIVTFICRRVALVLCQSRPLREPMGDRRPVPSLRELTGAPRKGPPRPRCKAASRSQSLTTQSVSYTHLTLPTIYSV